MDSQSLISGVRSIHAAAIICSEKNLELLFFVCCSNIWDGVYNITLFLIRHAQHYYERTVVFSGIHASIYTIEETFSTDLHGNFMSTTNQFISIVQRWRFRSKNILICFLKRNYKGKTKGSCILAISIVLVIV